MDVIFILAVAALYAATHWLIGALARLGAAPMSVSYALSALLRSALFAYLLYALLKPEKF